jgi:hypothetical protein
MSLDALGVIRHVRSMRVVVFGRSKVVVFGRSKPVRGSREHVADDDGVHHACHSLRRRWMQLRDHPPRPFDPRRGVWEEQASNGLRENVTQEGTRASSFRKSFVCIEFRTMSGIA